MKKSADLFLFTLSLIADLTGIYLQNESLIYAAKPAIVISLMLYFFGKTSAVVSSGKKLIAGALVFSWIGDVLLMFEPQVSSLFIFGLIAFLVAHVFYIFFFAAVMTNENIRLRRKLIIPVFIYYAALILFLYPYLGEMRWPVKGYGLVISSVLLLALHLLFIRNKPAGRLMMAGALLFILSDSVLALNKFYHSFEFAGIIIMLTYGLAQFFITAGAAWYIRSVKST
jgi:uncharacterized membrane protein YhhN